MTHPKNLPCARIPTRPPVRDAGRWAHFCVSACFRLPPTSQPRAGGILVLLLMLSVIIIILGAFAINLAHLQLVRTEMQVASDASARAANRMFANSRDFQAAQEIAQRVANENPVNSRPLVLRSQDFELGTSTRTRLDQRYQYTPGGAHPNSIVLRTEKSAATPSGPVELIFPGFLGTNTASVSMESKSTQVELDIALVIDRSGSMAYAADEPARFPPYPRAAPPGWDFGQPVPDPSRWLDTVDGIRVFLEELDRTPQLEHVSLITYSTNARIDLQPTSNYSRFQPILDRYSNNFQSGHTNIGMGLRQAGNSLVKSSQARPWAVKVIVLMTDGLENRGPNSITEARRLADDGLMIFTVTFSDEANQNRMREVANIGGGRHYHATSGDDLRRVFRDIGRRMPTLVTR